MRGSLCQTGVQGSKSCLLALCLSTIPHRQSAVLAERRSSLASKGLLPDAARLTLSSGTTPADLMSWRHSMACARLYAWAHFQVTHRTSEVASPLPGSVLAVE